MGILNLTAHWGGGGKGEALRVGSDRDKPMHRLPPQSKEVAVGVELPEGKAAPKTSSGSAQALLCSAGQGRERAEDPQPK